MHPAPSRGQDGPGRFIWDWRGLVARRRAKCTARITFHQTALPAPSSDASRQLAQEGAQNNPDSWGKGVPWTQALAVSQDTWNPVLAACGDLMTLGNLYSSGGL